MVFARTRVVANARRPLEVKYKSDLTDIQPIDPNTIESDGELFRAV